jgi:hypothetical protein
METKEQGWQRVLYGHGNARGQGQIIALAFGLGKSKRLTPIKRWRIKMRVYLIKEKENNNVNDIKIVDARHIVLEVLKMYEEGKIDYDVIAEYDYDMEDLSDMYAVALLEESGYTVGMSELED